MRSLAAKVKKKKKSILIFCKGKYQSPGRVVFWLRLLTTFAFFFFYNEEEVAECSRLEEKCAPSIFFHSVSPFSCGCSKQFQLKIPELFRKALGSSLFYRQPIIYQMRQDLSSINLVTKIMEEKLVLWTWTLGCLSINSQTGT